MFYTYIYIDPRTDKPIYVGKGCGGSRRHRDHLRGDTNVWLARKLEKLRRIGLEPRIEIDGQFEREEDAYTRERELIALHGRADLDNGTLCNLTDGGEGSVGAVRTEANRKGMRERWSSGVGAKVAAGQARAWSDEAHRAARIAAVSAALSRPDVKERLSAAAKLQSDAARRREISERAKTYWASLDDDQRKRGATAKNWSDPAFKERAAAAITAARNKWWIVAEGRRFSSTSEAAQHLGKSRRTVVRLCQRGTYQRELKAA